MLWSFLLYKVYITEVTVLRSLSRQQKPGSAQWKLAAKALWVKLQDGLKNWEFKAKPNAKLINSFQAQLNR